MVGLIGLAGVLASCGLLPAAALPATAPSPAAIPPPPSPEQRVAFADAVLLLRHRRYAAAVPRFQSLLQSYPALADYHLFYLGRALASSGQAADAVAPLRRLIAEYPRSVKRDAAALALGRVEMSLHHPRRAGDALRTAAAGSSAAIAHRATLELARLEIDTGNVYEAARLLQDLRRNAPGEKIALAAKAELQRLRAAHPDLEPTGADLVEELRLLVGEHDYTTADQVAQRLLSSRREDRAEVLRLRAQALLGLRRVDDAIAALRAVVRAEAGSALAAATVFRIGTILWNRDRDVEALAEFEGLRRHYRRARQRTEALYAIGRIHEHAGKTSRALAAYRRLAREAPRDPLARGARWRVGWIYYRASQWQAAERSFASLARCRSVAPCADALYWQARALDHLGRTTAAGNIYRRIRAEAPTSYYAMWAERRLALPSSAALSPVAVPVDTVVVPPRPDFHFDRAIELKAAGLPSLARIELAAYERDHRQDVSALRRLLRWYPVVDGEGAAIRLLRRLGGQAGLDAEERQRILYPLGFWPEVRHESTAHGLDPLLVAALIRQESLYDPQARSPANARGLMQLLPGTARRVAGEPVTMAELYDPQRNISLGTTYLAQLLARFDGDRVKALAAYNGGVAAVRKWERRSPGPDGDEFVESISYRETRDYVKRVIAGYRQYRQLYAPAP